MTSSQAEVRTIFDILPSVPRSPQNQVPEPSSCVLVINGHPYRHLTLRNPLSTPLMRKLNARQRRQNEVSLQVDLRPSFSIFAAEAERRKMQKQKSESQEMMMVEDQNSGVFRDAIFLLLCYEQLPSEEEDEDLSLVQCLSLMEFLHHHDLRIPLELIRRAAQQVNKVPDFFDLLNAIALHLRHLHPSLEEALHHDLQGYIIPSARSTLCGCSTEERQALLEKLESCVSPALENLMEDHVHDPAHFVQLILCLMFSWPFAHEHQGVRQKSRILSSQLGPVGSQDDLWRVNREMGALESSSSNSYFPFQPAPGQEDLELDDGSAPESTATRMITDTPLTMQWKTQLVNALSQTLARHRLLLMGLRPLLREVINLKTRALLALSLQLYRRLGRDPDALPWNLAQINRDLDEEEIHALEDYLSDIEATFLTLRHAEEDLVREKVQQAILSWLRHKTRPTKISLVHSACATHGGPQRSVLEALEWWKDKKEFVIDRDSSRSPFFATGPVVGRKALGVSFAAPQRKRFISDEELGQVFEQDPWTHLEVMLSADDLKLAEEMQRTLQRPSLSVGPSLRETLRLLKWPLSDMDLDLRDTDRSLVLEVSKLVDQCQRDPQLARQLRFIH